MYSIQIRRYSQTGKYQSTLTMEYRTFLGIHSAIDAWLDKHTIDELKESMQTNPCNIMVRKDGKLISYKSIL